MTEQATDVNEVVEQLGIKEKIELVHGAVDPESTAIGYISGIERLDIPELRLTDGPLGVHAEGKPATSFPASISLAATFDPEIARKQGAAMGREARERNIDVLLGPGLNLIRVPTGGRNFEYYSEDPVLTSAFTRATVEGIQSQDVIATPKHFVANNQETNRTSVDVVVDEKVLRECYLPGFKSAVEAGAGSIMTAYNSVNGSFMSENEDLLSRILKHEWGFDGFVVSDWFGTVSTVSSANSGLDLEMPGVTREEMWEALGFDLTDRGDGQALEETAADPGGMPDGSNNNRFSEPLLEAIQAGDVSEDRLDDMVVRILRQMKRFGILDGHRMAPSEEYDSRSIAKSAAARGTVLLENEGVLPLDEDADIAVIGPGIEQTTTGGGSSEIDSLYEISTADGIEERANGRVRTERGIPEISQVSFFGKQEEDAVEREDPQLADAIDAASDAEVAVVVVQDTASESEDRDGLGLPGQQDELIGEVAAVNGNVVVVVQSSGPVELPWRDEASAILESWYPGQSDGEAIASVLFGDVDAGGRLPVSFAEEENYPTSTENRFPGAAGEVEYSEGLFIGYKYFDAANVEPTYPFGHGQSYADFVYHSAEIVNNRKIRVDVENTADRDGREVVQAYVSAADTANSKRPARELGGFSSRLIPAGECVSIEISLDEIAFMQFDEAEGWTTRNPPFTIEIAQSAQNVKLEITI
ncbi:glycoside hydrolase family 3 protein [Halococcus sp. IIIV-5B]|uniref:beta-glucosidase n=1 Tax=Halococcus sp. IIIV-5B TaxID=2321230 RepID=UPI000E7540B3|nr:glycoside hydrolase family 3 C-terminal domain-containing protein [Halococcus sp. IIIV-5B]RJT07911.1 glycoside hydrolase family 3 protein [Halococcus sp. IIIV-5B]